VSGAGDLIAVIDWAFASPHPGDAFLQGSFEGCEPFDEVGAFAGADDWRTLDAAFLDRHYSALPFFSEAGLRFFLPAYLVADLRGELMTADPLFGLIHGFSELAVDLPDDGVHHRSGGPVLLGPRRYGAITWEDASRHHLSVFCREEAVAIAGYLRWRRGRDEIGLDVPRIDAALDAFWMPRARSAPTRADLDAHGR
jgi:hypothetical protein